MELEHAAAVLRRAELAQVFAPLMKPTLRSFLDAIQAGDLSQLWLDHSLLFQDLTGTASTELWSFCIGADFVTMKINTQLHAMFQSNKFSPLRDFVCTTGTPSKMGAQLDALMKNTGECPAVIPRIYLTF